MKFLLRALILLLLVAPARAESLQIGLSQDDIAITSSFAGSLVSVFGTIERPEELSLERGAYDVVVTLTGPAAPVSVRRKERWGPIWINGEGQRFRDVPSFYAVAATRPLEAVAPRDALSLLQIGPRNLRFAPEGRALPPGERRPFERSLVRLRLRSGLWAREDGAVRFLSPTLFRATFAVPADVPVGTHTARAFLFRDGLYLNSTRRELVVAKTGFEQQAYALAHERGLVYGLLAVLLAVGTGWLAGVAFRKD